MGMQSDMVSIRSSTMDSSTSSSTLIPTPTLTSSVSSLSSSNATGIEINRPMMSMTLMMNGVFVTPNPTPPSVSPKASLILPTSSPNHTTDPITIAASPSTDGITNPSPSPVGSLPLLGGETFYGFIETVEDAILVTEACRRGLLPRVPRRLGERERLAIRPGSVFVFGEQESGIRRWTDGKLWSPSRIMGEFLAYRQLEAKTGPSLPVPILAKTGMMGSGMVGGISSSSLEELDNNDNNNNTGIGPSKRTVYNDATMEIAVNNGNSDGNHNINSHNFTYNSHQVGNSSVDSIVTNSTSNINRGRPSYGENRISRFEGLAKHGTMLKADGLVKRTISLRVGEETCHLICYLLEEDLDGDSSSSSTSSTITSLQSSSCDLTTIMDRNGAGSTISDGIRSGDFLGRNYYKRFVPSKMPMFTCLKENSVFASIIPLRTPYNAINPYPVSCVISNNNSEETLGNNSGILMNGNESNSSNSSSSSNGGRGRRRREEEEEEEEEKEEKRSTGNIQGIVGQKQNLSSPSAPQSSFALAHPPISTPLPLSSSSSLTSISSRPILPAVTIRQISNTTVNSMGTGAHNSTGEGNNLAVGGNGVPRTLRPKRKLPIPRMGALNGAIQQQPNQQQQAQQQQHYGGSTITMTALMTNKSHRAQAIIPSANLLSLSCTSSGGVNSAVNSTTTTTSSSSSLTGRIPMVIVRGHRSSSPPTVALTMNQLQSKFTLPPPSSTVMTTSLSGASSRSGEGGKRTRKSDGPMDISSLLCAAAEEIGESLSNLLPSHRRNHQHNNNNNNEDATNNRQEEANSSNSLSETKSSKPLLGNAQEGEDRVGHSLWQHFVQTVNAQNT